MFVLRETIAKVLPDLKEKAGEFEAFYLQSYIAMYSIIGMFVFFANLAMIYLDYIFLHGLSWQLLYFTVVLRILFSLFTFRAIMVARRLPDLERVNAMFFTWLTVTALYFLTFNFLRPTGHLTTTIDVLFIFGVYVFSGLRLRNLLSVMIFFSTISIALIFLTKVDVPFVMRILVSTVHVFAQGVGLISALQIQSFRRRAFLAYTKEREANQLATQLLQVDTLTGCLTRRYFFELAERELLRAKRYAHPVSVLMMDIDRFKSFNDQYGHRVGDQVLMTFSKTVIELKRDSDLWGRLGGEEFALLLPEADLANAQMAAARIEEQWSITDINVSGLVINATVSIGVAEFKEADGTFEELLHRADLLMYRRKHEHRNSDR